MTYALAGSIPPGKTDAVRAFFAEVLGPRRAEWIDQCRRSGVTEEHYWLQRDPEGDSIVVASNTDPARWFALLRNPENDFDRWTAEQVTAIWGPIGEPTGQINENLGEVKVVE